jgi:hypothetical protein
MPVIWVFTIYHCGVTRQQRGITQCNLDPENICVETVRQSGLLFKKEEILICKQQHSNTYSTFRQVN